MQDHLNVVLEAMRRAQAKVAFYLEPGNGNAQQAFGELVAILEAEEVMRAMRALQSGAPSVVPDNVVQAERALHKALAGS